MLAVHSQHEVQRDEVREAITRLVNWFQRGANPRTLFGIIINYYYLERFVSISLLNWKHLPASLFKNLFLVL